MRAGYPHTDHHNYKVLAHRAFGLVSLVVKPDKIQFGLTALLGRPRLESNFVAPILSSLKKFRAGNSQLCMLGS